MSMKRGGNYLYFLDGRQQDIREPWSWELDQSGSLINGQRIVEGRTVLDVRAEYDGPACRKLLLNWDPGQSSARQFSYELVEGRLIWQEASKPPSNKIELGSETLLFPLLRAASGPLLQLLSAGERQVAVPNISVAPDHADFLTPLTSQRRIEAQSEPGHYRYFGGEYGDKGCECHLDERGRLLSYEWESAGGLWRVELAGT